jgi:NAD(P)-dependent dehydrogenase (short-subunit alcohol dehydrogenase family)
MTDQVRRRVIKGAAAAGAVAAMGSAVAQVSSDQAPNVLDGKAMPEPPAERSAGPIRPGRGSMLQDKVVVVTGAARGIGRAIAVEMAANGADVVVIDIAGRVSPASNAMPATPEELDETVRMIKSFGRRSEAVKADIRDIGALRQIADKVERDYGKIDVVVANAAIQRWVPLLEMEDSDWRDVIDNNLNGTANTVRAFAPKMVARKKGRFILLSSMQGKHGTKDASSYSASKWGILGLMKSAAMELGEHNITERRDPRPRRYRTDPVRKASQRIYGRARTEDRTSDAATGLGQPRADRAAQGGLAAAGRYSPAAVFLASDAANMVTGAEYEVTGGDSAKDI